MIHALYTRLLLLAWALWLGGLVTLLLAVTTIFHTLAPTGDPPTQNLEARHTAGNIAAPIFSACERPMLLLAATALLSALGLLTHRRTFSRLAALLLLALAALLAIIQTAAISPRIQSLRTSHQTETPQFKQLHGASMGLYATMTLTLVAVGLFLPRAITPNSSDNLRLS